MIAEGWWQQGQQTHTRPPQIAAIFSLDSPINGLPNCLLARFVVGGDVSAELCSRWNHRDALDQRILALDGDASYIAVGASGDPAYANSLIAGGGNLRPQLVYNCSDSGESPTSSCIATPPSYISPCNPTSPTIEGDGHHLVIACPQVVQLVTSAPGGRPLRFQLQQRCRAHRTVRLTVDGDTWAARRMTYTLGSRRITRAAAPFAATVRRNTIGGRHARRVVGTVSLTRGGTARVSARIRCRSS
jgi:hypothetical protein